MRWTPSRGIAPRVVLMPVVPQQFDGIRTDPPVSVPSAPNTWRAARLAALPPDDPPVIRWGFHGLRDAGHDTP